MDINKYVNLLLYYSSKIINRNIVAAICINELSFLLLYADNIYDELLLNYFIQFLNGQIDKETI